VEIVEEDDDEEDEPELVRKAHRPDSTACRCAAGVCKTLPACSRERLW
jgi:hypothetical protein